MLLELVWTVDGTRKLIYTRLLDLVNGFSPQFQLIPM